MGAGLTPCHAARIWPCSHPDDSERTVATGSADSRTVATYVVPWPEFGASLSRGSIPVVVKASSVREV